VRSTSEFSLEEMKLAQGGTDVTSSGRLNTTLDWILDPPFVVSPAAKTFALLFGVSRSGCNWEPKATEMLICATSGTDNNIHVEIHTALVSFNTSLKVCRTFRVSIKV
jgi:hypothetical protein